MLIILLLLLLTAYSIEWSRRTGLSDYLFSLILAVFSFVIAYLVFLLINEASPTLFWPDSSQYDQKSDELVRDFATRGILETLANIVSIVGSYNFLYYVLVAFGKLSWPFGSVSLSIISNLLALVLIVYQSVRLIDCRRTLIMMAVLLLSTSLVFWSLFLLKDIFVTLFLISAIYFLEIRKRYAMAIICILMLIGLRAYFGVIFAVIVIVVYMPKTRSVIRKLALFSVFFIIIAVFWFAFKSELTDISHRAEFFYGRSAEWKGLETGIGIVDHLITRIMIMFEQMMEPVYPEKEVFSGLYAYVTWKILVIYTMLLLFFDVKGVRKVIKQRVSLIALMTIILLFAFYSFFPRFANYRHRLPVEPLVLIYVARHLKARNDQTTLP